MSKQNIFDTVMDYIDDNIKAKDSEIKKGIYAISNYTDMDFNKFLSVLSKGKYTLYNYIYNRRMYMAVKELTDEPKKNQ